MTQLEDRQIIALFYERSDNAIKTRRSRKELRDRRIFLFNKDFLLPEAPRSAGIDSSADAGGFLAPVQHFVCLPDIGDQRLLRVCAEGIAHGHHELVGLIL